MVFNYFFDETEVSFDVQLLQHIKDKNDEKVESILQNAKELYRATDATGSSLLHYAAEFGNEVAASYLIKLGSQVNVRNKDGNTPLILATKGQHVATIKLLLESDVDIYTCNNENINALQVALQLSPMNIEIAKIFLEQLASDCSSDSMEIAKRLMKINCPFYVAVLAKDKVALRHMLSGGWSINAKDPSSGKSALHVAVENLDSELVKSLLHFGADVNATDALSKTPLAMLKSCDDQAMSILQYLLDARSDVTLFDEDGFLQMHWILTNGTSEAVEKALNYRFDQTTTDEHKQNIFHYLARNINDKVVDLLDDMKIIETVNLNARDEGGSTPLHHAMDAGNSNFVWTYADKSATNLANNKGVTPFLQAIESKSVATADAESKHLTRSDCVRILMMKRASPDILLGQYFKIHNTKSAVKRDFDLLKHVVAMLAVSEANGEMINEDVLDQIEAFPQLKECFDLSASVVDQLKGERVYINTSLFDYVAGNKDISDSNVISSLWQDFSITRNRINKYKSIPVYCHILIENRRAVLQYGRRPGWPIAACWYLWLFYIIIKLWLIPVDKHLWVCDDNGDDDYNCYLLNGPKWYDSNYFLISAFILCSFILFKFYGNRKNFIKF